jgi:hypothetical protein
VLIYKQVDLYCPLFDRELLSIVACNNIGILPPAGDELNLENGCWNPANLAGPGWK